MTEPQKAGPPWLRPEQQQLVDWRDGDIVISVPIKSGTTWTMNIVYQLVTGGDPDFEDIYAEVPWLEFVARPGQPPEELLERIAHMRRDRPRAFKTHAAPPMLPFLAPGGEKDVKYIVVCRNPEEALVSAKPFFEQHTDAWFELWNLPKGAMVRPDFATFYQEVIDPGRLQGMLFGFLAAWWPLRHHRNVLMLHYADMTRDHEGSIRKIADFLGVAPSAAQWPAILEYTSFPWMKAHQEKFEAASLSAVPVLERGAMVRKGRAGDARSDGMTEEISRHLRRVGDEMCRDRVALDWFYTGGPVPA
ncbi:MAG: sulfotransferase domain-containing protein [Vicinamibacterales bacterium]